MVQALPAGTIPSSLVPIGTIRGLPRHQSGSVANCVLGAIQDLLDTSSGVLTVVSSRWSAGAPREHVQELPVTLFLPGPLTTEAIAKVRAELGIPDGRSVLRFRALGFPLVLSGDLQGAYSRLGLPHLASATPVLAVTLDAAASRMGSVCLRETIQAGAGHVHLEPSSDFLPMLGGLDSLGRCLGLFTGMEPPLGPVGVDMVGRLWYSHPDLPGGDRKAILRQYDVEAGSLTIPASPLAHIPPVQRTQNPRAQAPASLCTKAPASAPAATPPAPRLGRTKPRQQAANAEVATPLSPIRSALVPASVDVGSALAAILATLARLENRVAGLEGASGAQPPLAV